MHLQGQLIYASLAEWLKAPVCRTGSKDAVVRIHHGAFLLRRVNRNISSSIRAYGQRSDSSGSRSSGTWFGMNRLGHGKVSMCFDCKQTPIFGGHNEKT